MDVAATFLSVAKSIQIWVEEEFRFGSVSLGVGRLFACGLSRGRARDNHRAGAVQDPKRSWLEVVGLGF